MKTPTHLHAYEDRCVECQFALEPLILDLLRRAAADGWNRTETVGAIASVIADVLLADAANMKAAAQVAPARTMQ
jgi:hypothetical protein